MGSPGIKQLLDNDAWSIAEATTPNGPVSIRFRSPVPEASDLENFVHVVRVVWLFAEEGFGYFPNDSDNQHMETFEDRLVLAWENEKTAVLTAVITFDGARQWVWYARDVLQCQELLQTMLQEEKPYPIELDTFEDPFCQYLNEEILGGVNLGEE